MVMIIFLCRYVDCYYELYTTSDNMGLVVYVDVVDVTLSCDDDTIQLHVYDGKHFFNDVSFWANFGTCSENS